MAAYTTEMPTDTMHALTALTTPRPLTLAPNPCNLSPHIRACALRAPPRARYVFLKPSDAAPGRLNFAPFITWRCHCTVRQRVLMDLIIGPWLFVISRRSLHRYTMRKRLPVSALLLQQVTAFVTPALRNVHKSRAPLRHDTANKHHGCQPRDTHWHITWL